MTKCERPNCQNEAVTINKLGPFFEEVCELHRMPDAEREEALKAWGRRA